MRLRILFPTLALVGLAASTTATAQVPNGGFEQWADSGTYQYPVGWITFNAITALAGADPSCEQSSPGVMGSYYATVTTRNTAFGLFQGILTTGDAATGTAGFPFASRPATFTGKWQYEIQPQDTGMVVVYLTKWNTATQISDSVGGGAVQLTGSLSGWSDMVIPIAYFNSATPDTAYIVIASSTNNAVEGSFVKVDDLGFGVVSGIDEAAVTPEVIKLFPSPATDVFTVSAERPLRQVNVLDMTGRTVLEQAANRAQLTLNIADLRAGRYLVQVQFADGDRQVRSLVKQ